jgi:FKBP-type peptidyl-prolyl cis-trans isomerase (trigger factor)
MLESMRAQKPIFTAVERAAQETDRVTMDSRAASMGKYFPAARAMACRW